MSRFVITGTGRCGTQWASKVLTRADVICGHQSVLTHRQTLGKPTDWRAYDGDASYEAAPLLGTLDGDVVKVLLVRHPLAVMQSWLELGVFVDPVEMWETHGMFSRVLDMYCPTVLAQSGRVNRAAMFWLTWNDLAISGGCDALMVEETSPASLFAAVGRQCPADFEPVSFRTNNLDHQKQFRPTLRWSDIHNPALRGSVQGMARVFGYEVNE